MNRPVFRRTLALLLSILLLAGGFTLGRFAATYATGADVDALPAETIPVSEPGTGPSPAVETEPAAPTEPVETAIPEELPWYLMLVNRDNPLPEDFTVPPLTQLQGGHYVDSRIYQALQDMLDAARAEGLQPLICSSYRTEDTQVALYQQEVEKYYARGYGSGEAEALAAMWVAIPGTSEHQTGLAVDIVDINYQVLDEGQEDTPVQQWLMEHCAEYGFILRYPTKKSDITGINYEPWHYRYVGVEDAVKITESGLCLEEYLGQRI